MFPKVEGIKALLEAYHSDDLINKNLKIVLVAKQLKKLLMYVCSPVSYFMFKDFSDLIHFTL